MDDEECVLGVRAVAAPVFSAHGEVEAALSISGPISRISNERIRALAASLVEAANTIAMRLGNHPRVIGSLPPQETGRIARLGDNLSGEQFPH